jgi:WD40 repeat protein/serine/threonine protein kinase
MKLPAYVGRYEVRDEIGRGGFAIVIRAWDEELQSFVAVKILHQALTDDEELILRFLDEARLLRRIRSPHVVTVHDVGRLNDGRPYFVMDFADRGTLEPRLQKYRGSASADSQSIMALVDALADSLSALHEAEVVHRDIKPANILFQLVRRGSKDTGGATLSKTTQATLVGTDERILLGDLGIAKDLSTRSVDSTVVGGTPLYQAPEQSDSAANITPAADIYAATAMLWHLIMGQRPPSPYALGRELTNLPPAWHKVFELGMALDPADRFSDINEWRSIIHETVSQEAGLAQSDAVTQAAPIAANCPYKGLSAYQAEDAKFFYGRETLIDELVRRLQQHRVLTVGGPSGSGKSSLVRAGLIPAITAGALFGRESWQVALFTPGRDPMAELYFQVAGTPSNDELSVSFEDLLERPTMARHLSWKDGVERPLILCIDQFEELFTLAPAQQREKFISAISAMTDPADSEVRVVIVVRADFYGQCAQIPWLAEHISHNQVLVGPMTDPELRRAVIEPARQSGLHVESSLVDAIIHEAAHEAGSLPLVAHALVETWMRRHANVLTLEGFHAAGGVVGAISQTAEATFEQRFDDAERMATRRLFLRLVTTGSSATDTRRAIARSEIEQDSQPEVMSRAVACLTEARLLTVDDKAIQIAHEALLRTWPRLRRWIDESRDDLRQRQRISHAAAEWESGNRDADLLYRGTPLLAALDWAEKNPDQLDMLGREFLDMSAEAKARSEALAVEREHRSRRLRHIAISGLSLLALGTTLASIVAFVKFREARSNGQLAELATAEARERFAGALGAVAHGLVDKDPLLSLVLGAESVARAETAPPAYDARVAMVVARRFLDQGGPFLVGSPVAAGDALVIALSPDGTQLATGQRDGTIELIDTKTGNRIEPSLLGHTGGIWDLEFGPNGRWLASAGADGVIRLWDLASRQSTRLGEIDDVVMGICFSPSGATLASANGDGTVRLWDVSRGIPIGEPLAKRTLAFKVIEFTPDGRGLVAGNNDGNIYGWALPSREPLFEPIRGPDTSHLSKLVFSPDGNWMAATSTDGTSILFDFPRRQSLGRAFDLGSRIGTVEFSADSDTLIGGSGDGTVRLWDVNKRQMTRMTPRGHSRAILDAGLSHDGRLLATLGQDQLIRFWHLGNNYPAATVHQVAGQKAKGLAFSHDGRHLAAGDDSGMVQVWELGRYRDPILLAGHKHQVWALAFSPGGSLVASADRAGQLSLWDASAGALRWSVAADQQAIWSVGFTPDGRSIMTASDTRIRFWEVETGAVSRTLPYEGGPITRAILSPDGGLVAVASADGKIRLYDALETNPVKEFVVDDNAVWSVAFSPDGQRLATASSDEVVALWDIATGQQLAEFAGHSGGATDIVYLADGVTLVAVDRSGNLHLWDVSSGRRLTEPWPAHAGASWRIALHPDGKQFGTSGDDGRVKLWDELSVAQACKIGGLAFDEMRRRQYLGDTERSMACGPGP